MSRLALCQTSKFCREKETSIPFSRSLPLPFSRSLLSPRSWNFGFPFVIANRSRAERKKGRIRRAVILQSKLDTRNVIRQRASIFGTYIRLAYRVLYAPVYSRFIVPYLEISRSPIERTYVGLVKRDVSYILDKRSLATLYFIPRITASIVSFRAAGMMTGA